MFNKIWGYVKTAYQKGLFHVFTGGFMTKLVAFFGSIFLVRVLSKQDYGVLTYLDNFYGYVHVLAGMGLANAVLRYVILAKTPEEKYGYYRYANSRSLLWNAVLILLAAVFFLFYPHKTEYQSYVWLLNIMLLMLPFHYITENALSNERAMFANQRYAAFSLLLSASIIASKILSGYIGGLHGVIFVQTGVYILFAVFFGWLTRKKHYSQLVAVPVPKPERKTVNRYSLQYMITNGLWSIFMLNDTFLLGRFSTPEVLADYRVAYTIPGCVNLISTAIGIFIAPYFVKHEQDREWVKRNFKKTYLLSATAVGVCCLGIALLARPVVWLLYGEQYLNIVPIMQLLLLAAFFNCGLRYTTANLLAAMGQVKYNMLVSAIGMALQIGLNLWIIPIYGVMGVAFTSCIVYFFMAVVLLILFLKKYYTNKKEPC